uniref:EF-hand domain-containing protein n=1 Tax=Pyramimonas obovata TaxID=1411642 RepID=A0A7S0R6X3_9CHLO
MSAAVVAAAARRSAKRQQKQKHEMQERQKAAYKIFQKFDTDHSGTLDDVQLRNMLAYANEGKPVSDEVVRWCRGVAEASDAANRANGVSLRGCMMAVDAFYAYKKNEPQINELFSQYDTNKSGVLEPDQLKALLTDLNDGVAPSPEELHWVISTTDKRDGVLEGTINKAEVMFAISLWYSVLDETQEDGSSCIIN